MTNPAHAMRMLITYAVIIPVAIFVGYLLTDPMNYGTMGFIGFLGLLLVSPLFIKFHYPILIFGLGCPAFLGFMPGRPPVAFAVVALSLFIAVTERILNSEKRFIKAPVMVWPLVFIAGMVYLTAELTGGIGLHSYGGSTGGGKKYITIFIGVATFFALTSQVIPPERRNFYIALYFLTPLMGIIRDLASHLPGPLKVVGMIFPPTAGSTLDAADVQVGTTRLVSVAFAVGTITVYLLVKHGLRGVTNPQHPVRMLIFFGSIIGTLLGGFRNQFGGFILTVCLLFMFERIYRTRQVLLFIFGGLLGLLFLVTFSDKLPYTFQRAMSFLPLKWDAAPLLDAQGTSEWRFKIWRDTWPKVPQYLLLGKGYALTQEDFDMIQGGTFANAGASHLDASNEALAISSDFHNGPLSTLIPFGLWGGIGMLWLMGASLFVLYRNYKYGDPTLSNFNTYTFVGGICSVIAFFFIFGGFQDDVGTYARMVGFSIAINGGIAKRPAREASNPRIKPAAEGAVS